MKKICKKPKKINCEGCGVSISMFPFESKRFCSNSCALLSIVPRRKKHERLKISCPVCGIIFSKRKNSKQKLCSRACSFKSSIKIKKCMRCGVEYNGPSFGKGGFCSSQCYSQYRSPIKIAFCLVCGGPFTPLPRRTGKYCSHECASRFKTSVVCTQCGGELVKCYGNMKLCDKCHEEYRYKNYLVRLRRKFANAYGQDKIDTGFEIKRVEALSSFGLATLKGDGKWVKKHRNEVRLAMESSK